MKSLKLRVNFMFMDSSYSAVRVCSVPFLQREVKSNASAQVTHIYNFLSVCYMYRLMYIPWLPTMAQFYLNVTWYFSVRESFQPYLELCMYLRYKNQVIISNAI